MIRAPRTAWSLPVARGKGLRLVEAGKGVMDIGFSEAVEEGLGYVNWCHGSWWVRRDIKSHVRAK